ncbi:MAG: TonB family protein, partial [Deltaproteobacteria bacterium]|nr:TonB family protein [Deltaproteobacteria bacterium]
MLLGPVAALAEEAAQPPAVRRSENPLTTPTASEQAQSPTLPAGEPKPTGQLTRAPELLQFVEASYPPEAQASGLSGSVGLLVDLDDQGRVTAVEVTAAAGHGFDEAAVEAVKRFQFAPAEIDGRPAPVRIAYTYHFTITREEAVPPPAETVVTLRGQILQRGNRVPISAASVAVDEGAFGAVADEAGRFEVAGVPPGRHRVVVTAMGFDKYETEEEVAQGQVTEVTYYVRKRVFTPYETVVRGKREKKDVARVELRQEEIRLVPGTGGDAFKVVQDLPGVARAPYSFGLLIVRGGRPGDTRVYVDGVWVPIIFHFAGLTSVYNSDLLQDLTFLPGTFGAHDGRAMGGVVEAESRTPSKEAYHGYANISLLDSTLLIEGPISQSWSFAAAGRVSYVDLVLQEFLPASVQFLTAPRYWDWQLKAEYAPEGSRDRVSFQFFGAHDVMKLLLTNAAMLDPEGRNDAGASSDFTRVMGNWRHTFQPDLTNKLTVAFGWDSASTSVGSDLKGTIALYALQLRDAVTWEPLPSLSLTLGTDSLVGWHSNDVTRPPLPLPGEVPDPLISRQVVHALQSGVVFEPGLYLDATWKPFARTRIIPGLRLDYEATLEYFTVDPRLTIFQGILEGTTLKGAVGLYQQPPDFRMQQWTEEFGNPRLGAERSIQAMLGVEQKFTDAISLDVQVYYKHLSQLLWQSSRTVERDGQQVLERYNNSGEGRAYGVEVLLRHELTSRFFGWVSYSFSRSERRSTLWDDPSFRLAQFDQPHHLIAVASYKWPFDFVTGLRFQYASGNLSTPFPSTVYDSDADLYMP